MINIRLHETTINFSKAIERIKRLKCNIMRVFSLRVFNVFEEMTCICFLTHLVDVPVGIARHYLDHTRIPYCYIPKSQHIFIYFRFNTTKHTFLS